MNEWPSNTLEEQKEHDSSLFPVSLHVMQHHTLGCILPPHWHDKLEFIYVTKGEIHFSINNESFYVHAGDCLFINSCQLHAGFSRTPLINYCSIVFSSKLLTNSLDICQNFFENITNHRCIMQQHFHSDIPAHYEIIEHIKRMITALTHKNLAYELIVKSELLVIFSILIQTSPQLTSLDAKLPNHQTKNNERLEQIITYISLHYHEKIALTDISEAVHVTPQYLCRFFKNMTTMSLIDYINHYRIERARSLLEESRLSITDIALMCGFDNISYFNRVFKQHIHCTPSKSRLNKK
ncbi:AraC family transcriptional regulator [Cellulosilyticum lentocellum]|uniref:Transcriptional regulator, AraC family n=1 Tax=Cellulosilyticum lentocellum (strain ATCC 49066 / DSM 5427 / NCIMB 11756 / RHM5) TaxID=642492 RepID=F2JJB6_CELLD|nr:AraC family transcriptional regulator [Cellulosilyticum lentocellum]ADZ84409.1 transcriptional regulator, AraC family [Cellulosilyticum lentocellum DSM 5427]